MDQKINIFKDGKITIPNDHLYSFFLSRNKILNKTKEVKEFISDMKEKNKMKNDNSSTGTM